MFTTAAYSALMGAAATFADVAAIADSDISTRNNHFLFTDDFRMLGMQVLGATVTRARLNAPTINAFGRHQLWPLQQSGTQPDDPRIPDYRDYPLQLPVNEEIALEASNSGAGEQEWGLMLLSPGPFDRSLPSGIQRITLNASYTITTVANTWTGPGNLTFAENIRGGMYSIVGMQVFDANTHFARLIFPRGNMKYGRRLKPGCMVQNAVANRPWMPFFGGLGLWGQFQTTELPQIEVLALNAAAHTGVVMLDCIYHGQRDIVGA